MRLDEAYLKLGTMDQTAELLRSRYACWAGLKRPRLKGLMAN